VSKAVQGPGSAGPGAGGGHCDRDLARLSGPGNGASDQVDSAPEDSDSPGRATVRDRR
jgi:hypothetical protein